MSPKGDDQKHNSRGDGDCKGRVADPQRRDRESTAPLVPALNVTKREVAANDRGDGYEECKDERDNCEHVVGRVWRRRDMSRQLLAGRLAGSDDKHDNDTDNRHDNYYGEKQQLQSRSQSVRSKYTEFTVGS
jgi:hypothetical protein